MTIRNKNEIIVKPTIRYIFVINSGNELEKMRLIVKYTMWPPSSNGIGNKFNIEILSEKIMNIFKMPEKLFKLNLSAFFTMPMGPAKSLAILFFLNDCSKELNN